MSHANLSFIVGLALSLWGCQAGAPACLEGVDSDGDGLVLVGYAPGQARSPYAELEAFLEAGDGLDDSCVVVTARQASGRRCQEQPLLVYCPEVGPGRNIGNAVVHLATAMRPTNIHRGDSPYAPAQLNVDMCSYQTTCMGRAEAAPVAAGQQVLGSCEDGPVFADLFCHSGMTVALQDSRGVTASTVVDEVVVIVASCEGATWHLDDDLDLEPLPLREWRSLEVTASSTTTRVDLHAEVELDTDCDLLLGNSRRPFGALELTGPGWAQACFADGDAAMVVEVPADGADGVFWLGEGQLDLAPPMAARLHDGSEGAADVALCLDSAAYAVDGLPDDVTFTIYGYAEPAAHPERAALSHLLAPYDAWPTWLGAHRSWTLDGRLVAGPPEASLEQLCGQTSTSCAW
jgi:hypothetical protein